LFFLNNQFYKYVLYKYEKMLIKKHVKNILYNFLSNIFKQKLKHY